MNECPHCPDGHPPFQGGSHPWNVFVGPDVDGDGQPTHLVVARSAGEHCAQSDADALYELINRRDSSPVARPDERLERDAVNPGLLIGLSGENVTQLLANEPVVVDAGELGEGMSPMQLVLRPVPGHSEAEYTAEYAELVKWCVVLGRVPPDWRDTAAVRALLDELRGVDQ